MANRAGPYLKAWKAAGERDGFHVDVTPFDEAHPDPDRREPFGVYVADYRTRIGDWVISGLLQVVDGQLSLGTLDVRLAADKILGNGHRRPWKPDEMPASGVTTDVVRSIPIGRLIDQARLALLAFPTYRRLHLLLDAAQRGDTATVDAQLAAADGEAAAIEGTVERRRGPGRPGLPDGYYRDLAEQYLALHAEMGSRGLLEELGARQDPPRTRETMRDHVRRATLLGYLTKATRGRGGRSPGPRLLTDQGEPTP